MTGPQNETHGAEPAILLVEDSIDEALLVQTALGKVFSIPVVLVQDGDQGLSKLQEQQWALAIFDLNLPGVDGIQLIKAAKTFRPGMPVIAVTGYTSSIYLEEAYRAGADAVLTKPIDLAEFSEHAKELIRSTQTDEPGPGAATPMVIAVGSQAGDVEMGCGGILFKHRQQGHDVVIAIMGPRDAYESAAAASSALLGAELLFHPLAEGEAEVEDGAAWLRKLVEERKPVIVYGPSMQDQKPDRVAVHRICSAVSESVPKVMAYQTPTSGIRFSPQVFVDIGPYITNKLALVEEYEDLDLPNTGAAMVRASARYWGRFTKPFEVEPLEIVKA